LLQQSHRLHHQLVPLYEPLLCYMYRKKKGIREIKFVSLEPIFYKKLNINKKEMIVKSILLAVLMLMCVTFGSSLNAMTRHSASRLPKDGQLIALIHSTQIKRPYPVYMITHYNEYDHTSIIYESGRWYTCNLKDIKRLLKKEHPFFFWCDHHKMRVAHSLDMPKLLTTMVELP